MARLSQRESVLLGCSPQSPKALHRNSDVDFTDVFGGPPRRSLIQEMRHSFSETADSSVLNKDGETNSSRNPWSGLSEKPAFGDEVVNRRRYPTDDFFNDIFKGNEFLSSSPRKHDGDPFSSTPSSRALSPAPPLPPKAEPFASSSQFSLPAKLIKGTVELPTFGSAARNQYRNKDNASNGVSSYAYSPLSRNSSQGNQGQAELKNDLQSVYHWGSLSQDLALEGNEFLNLTKSDETEKGGNLKKHSKCSEVSENGIQFHFSIYKWASKGVPLALPPRGGNCSRVKEKAKIQRCSSSSGRISGEQVRSSDVDFTSFSNSVSSKTKSSVTKLDKEQNGSLFYTSPDVCVGRLEELLSKPKSKTPSINKCVVEDICSNTVLPKTREETKPHPPPEVHFHGKKVEEISTAAQEANTTELKPLSSLLFDDDHEQGDEKITGCNGVKANMIKISKNSSASVHVSKTKNVKKQDERRTALSNAEVNKGNLQVSPLSTRDNFEKSRVRGKVKEFVKIFNQEASAKPKFDVNPQGRSSRWKGSGTFRVENDESVHTTRTNDTMQVPSVSRSQVSDASIMTDEYLKQPEKQHSAMKSNGHMSNNASSGQKDGSATIEASVPDDLEANFGDTDESFHGNFVIKELHQDVNKLRQTSDNEEEIQVVDAKIRQWSYGKQGNIRSLLSTLQYVLWPESGWKPVPLVDIIEGNAVKRSYQKALLCLHPDKLQQKGAASHQKYMAEKVFDILQEAWAHFNSIGSL